MLSGAMLPIVLIPTETCQAGFIIENDPCFQVSTPQLGRSIVYFCPPLFYQSAVNKENAGYKRQFDSSSWYNSKL